MNNRQHLLTSLETDADARATFVEVLRCACELLTGEANQYPEAIRVQVAHQTAKKLLDAAARLCDHARVSADGRCRYCETLIIDGDF